MPRLDTAADHARMKERWDALCDLAPAARRRMTFAGYNSLSLDARCAFEAELLGRPVVPLAPAITGAHFWLVIVGLVLIGIGLAGLIEFAL